MDMIVRDLAALATEQYKALTKCQHERDDALLALRAVIGVIEGEHVFRPDSYAREIEILAIAKKALEAN